MGFNAENFATTLPALTASAEWGSAEAASSLPVLTQLAAGDPSWNASLTLHSITGDTDEEGGFQASMSLFLLQSNGVGISGGTGIGSGTSPLLTSDGSGEAPSWGDNTLPLLTSTGGGYENVEFAASNTLPLLQMSAAFIEILAETFEVWVMDAKTKGVSKYLDYNFNSFGKRDGVQFGVNANGIYRLDAEDDAGTHIAAKLLFAPTGGYYEGADFGLSREEATRIKRMASIYLVCRSDDDLQLLVQVDEDKYRAYSIDKTSDPQGLHNRRVVPGRKLEGVVWQVGVANLNGADFELAAIKAYPIVTSRRV